MTARDAQGSASGVLSVTVVPPQQNGAVLAQLQAKLAAIQSQVSSSNATSTTIAPPSAASGSFTSYMFLGLKSQEVVLLQTTLIQLGLLSGQATGYFGSLTEAAVKQFQASHGLEQLGVVGPGTRAALNALGKVSAALGSVAGASTTTNAAFTSFLDLGSKGDEVTALQNKLTAQGFYSGPISGYFGALTAAAVKLFQAAHEIDQKGYVGPATRAILNK
jgi:peptidoglycan hydrolase-like protein with peptidoglycan-binding domain